MVSGRGIAAVLEVDLVPLHEGYFLARAAHNGGAEAGLVFSEAHVPQTLITLMEANDPQAIEAFRCRQMRRAVFRDEYKLITVGDKPDELFDISHDPGELQNLFSEKPDLVAELDQLLTEFQVEAERRRPANWESDQASVKEDGQVLERLRGLGYVE